MKLVLHLARGAWVEIISVAIASDNVFRLHLARGAWVEIWKFQFQISFWKLHLARGAWVEIQITILKRTWYFVAPRKRCVSRNKSGRVAVFHTKLHLARGAWVEIINVIDTGFVSPLHLARGAWVEMTCQDDKLNCTLRLHLARGAWVEMKALLSFFHK